jgi:hypothetical protein
MMNFASTTGAVVALSAAALSVVCALFVPYAYPWPSVAWALLACAAVISVAKRSAPPSPSMSDVINDVEGEPARAPASSRPVA